MTLQQLEYIIAVEQHGYFVNAAEACEVTQSTLSLMIKKLEEELDVKIFNRDTHPVTATVAPVIMPGLFHYMRTKHPTIHLRVEEMITATIIEKVKKAEIDMGILTYPVNDPDLLEIPLYHERFFAYVSPKDDLYKEDSIERSQMSKYKVWTMKDGVRLFDPSKVRSEEEIKYDKLYEGGRVGILIQITDENGGITIVPESHLHLLPETVKDRIRPIVNPEPHRMIGLVFRKDYVHERMMNIVIKAIKTLVPSEFLDGVIRADYLRL